MQTPLYDDVDALLAHYGPGMGASECHGMLCGILSWPVNVTASEWINRFLASELSESERESAEFKLHVDDEAMLVNLYKHSLAQLEDPELGFEPFLPDDDAPLAQRAVALTSWCDGYLYGLNLTGDLELHQLSTEAQEFSRDLLDISRLEHDPEEGEDGEAALFDIVEYVRMGVLMLRDELLALDSAEAGPKSPTLH